jgi:hypothetical protein
MKKNFLRYLFFFGVVLCAEVPDPDIFDGSLLKENQSSSQTAGESERSKSEAKNGQGNQSEEMSENRSSKASERGGSYQSVKSDEFKLPEATGSERGIGEEVGVDEKFSKVGANRRDDLKVELPATYPGKDVYQKQGKMPYPLPSSKEGNTTVGSPGNKRSPVSVIKGAEVGESVPSGL